MAKTCNAPDCYNPVFGKGYCKFHQHLRPDFSEKQQRRRERQQAWVKERNSKRFPSKIYTIPKMSEGMKKKYQEYRPARDKYMKEHPICEFKNCTKVSQDLHHKAGRGANLSRPETFMAVCRAHHNYIHANPKEARELGYLI